MRRVSLAARRARQYLRRPPKPRWLRPALYGLAASFGLGRVSGVGWWADAADFGPRAREAVVARVLEVS